MNPDLARSKVVSWQDPMISAARVKDLSGLEFMRALLDGTIPPPPIVALMGMTPTAVDVGTVTFECLPDESSYNPLGIVHGGLMCTLLDTVVGCAVHTTLPKGLAYTSLEIKVNYLRAVHSDSGILTAVGTVTKPGKRAAFSEGVVTDAEGRIVATASSTLLVFPAS